MNIVAVDVGATEIKGALFNPTLSKQFKTKTDASGGKSTILASLYKVIDALMVDDCDVISIVSAGTIDTRKHRIIYNAGTMPGWVDFNLGDVVFEKYQVKVFVENDANGAMIAEMQPYLKAGIKHAVMVTLGTGVGTALYIDGKMHHGANYLIELGHMVLYPKGRLCSCGEYGCIEQYVSGTALTRRAKEAIDPHIDHGKALFKLLAQGHKKAQEVFDHYIDDLAQSLHNIGRAIDPELFILGGGVMDNASVILPALKKKLGNKANHYRIVKAQYDNFAGIQGAFVYAKERMANDA